MASGLLEDLIESLRCLPGVGPKSAQRMALHLLQRDRTGATRLGEALLSAMERVSHCERCRIFHCLIASLAEIGRHCMGGVAEQHDLLFYEAV